MGPGKHNVSSALEKGICFFETVFKKKSIKQNEQPETQRKHKHFN